MRRSIVVCSFFSGILCGFLSAIVTHPRQVFAFGPDTDKGSLTLFDTVQARRILLVDDQYRTVMVLEAGDGTPQLTIQSADKSDRLMLRPGAMIVRREAQLSSPESRSKPAASDGSAVASEVPDANPSTVLKPESDIRPVIQLTCIRPRTTDSTTIVAGDRVRTKIEKAKALPSSRREE